MKTGSACDSTQRYRLRRVRVCEEGLSTVPMQAPKNFSPILVYINLFCNASKWARVPSGQISRVASIAP